MGEGGPWGVAERLDGVEGRISEACARSGRRREDVVLVAVTKTVPVDGILEAAACGLSVMGENRVQEALQKIPECPGGLSWHLVGHLQTNKVRHAVEWFETIHSVDSLRLLECIEEECERAGRGMRVCLEINVAGESSKNGLTPDAAEGVLDAAARCRRLEVVGLMTVPPFAPDPEKVRPWFRRLRECRDAWGGRRGLSHLGLSMGMSHDFEVAIEEGATWIRLGTALFGERPVRGA